MRTLIIASFTIITLTACEEIPVRHVTWVQSPTCANQDLGDPGCLDMGMARDLGVPADLGCAYLAHQQFVD
jgi:hypothetical protein